MPMGIRDMQFQSFSLRHQKILINFNVFSSGSSDILLKGVLSAELLILVDNLNAVFLSTSFPHNLHLAILLLQSR